MNECLSHVCLMSSSCHNLITPPWIEIVWAVDGFFSLFIFIQDDMSYDEIHLIPIAKYRKFLSVNSSSCYIFETFIWNHWGCWTICYNISWKIPTPLTKWFWLYGICGVKTLTVTTYCFVYVLALWQDLEILSSGCCAVHSPFISYGSSGAFSIVVGETLSMVWNCRKF